MQRILTTYILVIVLLSAGFAGVATMAKAAELRDPMQPPPYALQKFRQAKWAGKSTTTPTKAIKPQQKPLQLTSILYAKDRKVAIINDQMLVIGDRIRGAQLIKLTRATARLVRKGKVINLSLDNNLTAVRKEAVESDL
ncbi:MAG: hypothetical protein KJN95_05765 [Gammaproteobacteria bacterium]|nr:hypothetical protein [Gammaproteobacteria bacterium]MBT8437949.1 hypothetical protein [Gammaproteobacteria bacterium]